MRTGDTIELQVRACMDDGQSDNPADYKYPRPCSGWARKSVLINSSRALIIRKYYGYGNLDYTIKTNPAVGGTCASRQDKCEFAIPANYSGIIRFVFRPTGTGRWVDGVEVSNRLIHSGIAAGCVLGRRQSENEAITCEVNLSTLSVPGDFYAYPMFGP